jgi:carbamoyl-phosphate synthase large subunit
MKRILILGAGEMQVPVIRKANELGIYSFVADYDPMAPGFSYADQKVYVSTNDYDGILSVAKQFQVDGILTTSDFPVNIVAKVSQELGLSSMSESVAAICTNKFKQRVIFRNSSINVPFFRLCSKPEDVGDLNNFPYIIKPVDSSASRGVKKVFSKTDLQEHFSDALNYSKIKNVLIEEFIEGREFSVETFTRKNITSIVAITEKLVIGENQGYFVEDTHIEPARISPEEKILIEREVKKAIETIGLNNCPTHTEIKLNEKGAFIVEIACRLGGDYITSDLVPLSTGVDMLGNLIRISLGEDIMVIPSLQKHACIQFLNSKNYDRCKSFIESGDRHIVRYEIKEYHNREIKNSLDRMGYIILQGDIQDEIESILLLIK